MSSSNHPSSVRPTYRPAQLTDGREAGTLLLRDGARLTLSRALPEDAERVRAFVRRLPTQDRDDLLHSLNLKQGQLSTFLEQVAEPGRGGAFLVQGEDEEKVAAFAAFRLYEGLRDAANVGLAVARRWRKKGIATLLLERLAVLAAGHGVGRMVGVSQSDNKALIGLFRASGFEPDVRQGEGSASFLITTRPQNHEGMVQRRITSRTFVAASLRPLFRPSSVAVIGASRDPASLGHRIVSSLVRDGFQGPVFPVNPKADHIVSIRAYPSLAAIDQKVDLAVIALPAEKIPAVVDSCAAAGVKALIVISAYFAEVGEAGCEREKKLAEQVAGHGMRMLGPNCMGLIQTDPQVCLNASFSPIMPEAGSAALCSQSGALGIAITALARRLGLGLSSFVNVGNRADVSGNDVLEFWEEDPNTRVILFYLESFGNPRRFARLARRVGRTKPIIAVKAGRSRAGRRAAAAQASTYHATNIAVEALFAQTGVIRADNLDEMFDIARALTQQPLPQGRRVAVVTNAGGPAMLAADALEAVGLVVEPLAESTQATLRRLLPLEAQTRNPVDMLAAADAKAYRYAVECLLRAPEVDVLVVLYTPVGMADTEDVCEAVAAGVAAARGLQDSASKPVFASIVGEQERRSALLTTAGERIPVYAFPEFMGRLLGKITTYTEWRSSDTGVFPEYRDQRLPGIRRICEKAVSRHGEGWLAMEDVQSVLEMTGLTMAECREVVDAEQAVSMAEEIGFPVVLRLGASRLEQKTERHAVHLDLDCADAVREAFAAATATAEEVDGKRVVQRMFSNATEVTVGVRDDPRFGPLIGFGLGGMHMEVVRDLAFRVSPLTDLDARAMVRQVRGAQLLQGYRGHPAADVEAIEGALLRVSRLVEAVPQIAVVDLDPVMVLAPGEGYRIVDARIRLQHGS